ncbi:MAG: trigger factor [Lachnospiraceae bacterium]|nr:trigger factor [Lachnospiraceae bacterium]
MSYKTEELGKNSWKITIEVDAQEFEKACEKAYQKNKGKIQIQGFRKGKAPRALIEKMYGPSVFYEDAANIIIPDAYADAAKECGLEIVARPDIDVEQAEKGKPFIFNAVVATKPEVELGEYKGIEVEVPKLEVTDDEVIAELDKERERNSRTITVDDRAVADGDIVKIDYEGFVDGKAFDGGKAEDADLTIGSHTFIDTFEQQLIGRNIGDNVEVNVKFPEEYHAEELKGKDAMFKVAVKGISVKELPELDDDFAADVSDFDTLDEYKADVKKALEAKKKDEIDRIKEDAVIEKIIENSTMEIPKAMIDDQKMQMAEDYAQRLQYQGLSIEQYFKFTGMTAEKFLEEMEPRALKSIKTRLVLEAIAKAENIVATDEDIEKEFDDMSERYNMEKDKIREFVQGKELDNMKMDIACKKAVELVRDAAKETKAKKAAARKTTKKAKEETEA